MSIYVNGVLTLEAHKATHENGGGDEVSIASLSGQAADDQPVLDAQVVAAIEAEATVEFDAAVELSTVADDISFNPAGKTHHKKVVYIGVSSNQHTETIHKAVDPIVDNTATALLEFVVPYPGNYNTAAGLGCTLQVTFLTGEQPNALMISTVILHFSMVRIRARTADWSAIQFLGPVVTDEFGATASHAALIVGQFTFVRTAGAASAVETWELRFTNDFDPGVLNSIMYIAGRMDVVGKTTTVS